MKTLTLYCPMNREGISANKPFFELMKSKRKLHSDSKTIVLLEVQQGQKTLRELSSKRELLVSVISRWKEELLSKVNSVWELRKNQVIENALEGDLYIAVRQLQMHVEFLEKIYSK